MALEVFFRNDLRQNAMAGILLLVRSAQVQGGSAQYIAGALAMAQHHALAVGIDWSDLYAEARGLLSANGRQMLDAALRVQLLEG